MLHACNNYARCTRRVCDILNTEDLPPAGAGGTDSTGRAESRREARELNGAHHAANSSPRVQTPTAAAGHAQAVDLSNLFAGIWMDSAGDVEDTPESGEPDAGSESGLERCSFPGLHVVQHEMPHLSGPPACAADCSGLLVFTRLRLDSMQARWRMPLPLLWRTAMHRSRACCLA